MLAAALLTVSLAAPGPMLDGRWTSRCIAMGKNGRHGTILRATVAGDSVEAVAQLFAHADCDVPTAVTQLSARRSNTVADGGHITMTLTIDAVTMAADRPEVAAIWNQRRAAKRCGADDWQVGVPQSVAGATCTPGVRFPDHGARLRLDLTYRGNTMSLASPIADTDAGGHQQVIVLTRTTPQ